MQYCPKRFVKRRKKEVELRNKICESIVKNKGK